MTTRSIRLLCMGAAIASIAACNSSDNNNTISMEQQLHQLVNRAPGTIGIAFVSDTDTITINNGAHYAMMSVFKLHEALAVAHTLEQRGESTDSIIAISSTELDPATWSPMLKTYGNRDFDISIKELIEHALVSSDNNASNILFNRIVSPEETDSYVRTIAADTAFAIRHTEAEMKRNNSLCYRNYSSPLSAALLIRQVFTTQMLSHGNQEAIKTALSVVTTGHDRLGAATEGKKGILFAHKTGSGYRNTCGELTAFNDVAYIRLPDGSDYSLAVMIRDFSGSEEEAAKLMSRIAEIAYSHATAR